MIGRHVVRISAHCVPGPSRKNRKRTVSDRIGRHRRDGTASASVRGTTEIMAPTDVPEVEVRQTFCRITDKVPERA